MLSALLVLVLVTAVSALAVAVVAYGRAPLPKDPPAPPGHHQERDARGDRASGGER
jgi:hypothetical protein